MNLMKPPMQNSKEYWEARYGAKPEHLFSKEPSSFLMRAAQLLPKGAKVAELACGEGRNTVALALKSFQVKAFDFIPDAIERTKKLAAESKVEIETKLQDLDFFLPDLMTYDAIVAIDFKPPPTLIKNMIRGLKKDGLIIIENFLMSATKDRDDVEFFEAFKEGELLSRFSGPAMNYRVVHYNELADFETKPVKVEMIVRKTEML